ncbi:sensor histidine kinase [Aquimarina spinulae]|uniref:ATP-binding protein n=1 Tax=Aquimarina spinulae TaxID=1192023 RepID=UPI000D55D519|nr:sensor histidine kinase [Aquimarina spinulae]
MINYKYKISKFLPVIFCITGFCYGQNDIFKQVQSHLDQFQLDSASIYLQKAKSPSNNFQIGLYHYYSGVILKKKDLHDLGFKELLKAKNYFIVSDSLKQLANTNYEIYELLMHQQHLKIDPIPYLNDFISYADSIQDPLFLAKSYSKTAGIHLQLNDLDNTLDFYKKSIQELKKINDTLRIALIEMNIGLAFNTIEKKADSAFYYFKKTLPVFEKLGMKQFISINYNNQAKTYENIGDKETAHYYFKQASKINLQENIIKTRVIYYENRVKHYKDKNDCKNALEYAEKLLAINDTIDNQSQNNAIIEAENKYRAAEKEKEIVQLLNTNLKTEASRVQNRNLLIGSLSLILVGSIFVFLIYKNTKRKQRIAEQEREIQIQKTEKLLKEQELTAIDAMISGQEKERQRLANELHDNLGSTLATVKLHFQHIQHNKDNPKVEHIAELYTKTNALLDEAYQKVRTIAHEKNSGVMANQGLLPAVKKLAKKVSNGDGLHIEVQDYGLEERLDNALEISIFRMIQELITNTIKHANASEIHISLTNHDSLLNIIIEDNGKGFDAKILPKKEGMGLRNIEKRVEHLQGTFEIDSTIGKGTNIIINIPI